MTIYTWEYGSAGAGLQFTIAYDNATSEFRVTSLTGSFDLNALWFSDGNTASDGYVLVKSDNSLNMNGPNTVWEDGISSSQTIVWDTFAKLSKTGGANVEGKIGFISQGETQTFTLAALGLTTFDPDTYSTLGVRATSVNGTGEIKWVDAAPDVDEGDHVCVLTATTQLTGVAGNELSSDLAGNACLVAYSSTRAGATDIYFQSSQGGPETQLALPGTQTDPHMSGDPGDGAIVFTSDELGGSRINVYDTSQAVLTYVPDTGGLQSHPDISNDGTHVVFTNVSGSGSQIAWWEVGSNDAPFVIPGGSTSRDNGSISGDGRFVVFEDGGFGNKEILVYDTQTATTTRLTLNPGDDVNPSISDDGSYIVVQSANSDVLLFQQTSPGVFVALGDISSGANGAEVNPEISGDGRFVVFTGTVNGETDLYVWDRTFGGPATEISMLGEQRNAHISTDGQGISFESDVGGQFEVFTAPNPLNDDFSV